MFHKCWNCRAPLPGTASPREASVRSDQPPPDDTSVTVEVTQSKEQVFTIVRDVLNEFQADYMVEQRAHLRHPVCIPIEAIPFDREGNQAGPLFTAVTKDVSAAGLSLLHHSLVLD